MARGPRGLGLGLLLGLLAARVSGRVVELGEGFAVLEDACLSHVDASVLVWDTSPPRDGAGASGSSGPLLPPGSITEVSVRYHPLRNGAPGHSEYKPAGSHRTVLVRAAPEGAAPPADGVGGVAWRGVGFDADDAYGGDDNAVAGALVLGTFTMGAGTTASRPGFDMFSSTWHGFLEPLVDAWAHLRRLHAAEGTREGAQGTAASDGAPRARREGIGGGGHAPPLAACPRYDVYLTDEVLGPSRDWLQTGYLVAFWRALATHGASGLRSLLDVVTVVPSPAAAAAPKTRPYAAAEAGPWARVASGPLTCYRRVVVGSPCCSGYPFNGRGEEDLLGPFGDCMVEAAMRDAMRDGGAGGGGGGRKGAGGAGTTAAVASHWGPPWVSPPRGAAGLVQTEEEERRLVGLWGRRHAVGPTGSEGSDGRLGGQSGLASVLVLDRDECDRRLTSDSVASLLGRLRALRGVGRVAHAYFERLTRAEQLRTAADADLVRL
jgi:hypothetical protein